MDIRSRFVNTLNFKPVDRLPVMEWAGWWDRTIDRWHAEGLPAQLTDAGDIRDYFGMDSHRQCWIGAKGPQCPIPPVHGQGIVADMDEYRRIKPHLFPQEPFDRDAVAGWAREHKDGRTAVWVSLEGFFWFPRTLLGIEPHIYAFYDQPELMHTMNRDLLAFNLRALDEFCKITVPDFMTFAEDMSYNHGPMISQSLFDEFMAPYYRQIVPRLKDYGVIPIVDSDGEVEKLVPWLVGVGIEGFLPLEHQAGVDIVALRKKFPTLRLIGAFDKMVMNKGETAIRAEFERILPVMRQGGYIPGVDHQTPPGVSLDNYRHYLRLLNEYCRKAASV